MYWIIFSSALENLGIKDINRNPPGADMDEITLEVFLKEAWVYITNFSELYIYLERLP